MSFVLSVLYYLVAALSVWATLIMLFLLFITVKGFKKQTKDYTDKAPQSRFLIFVPAHNEQTVIADMVRCMQNLDYPKELYDYYILADNCTDKTAEVARNLGANVFEFFKENEHSPTGKPIALQKAFDKIGNYAEKYDFVMFFDADNIVQSNILKEVNSQMLEHPEAVATQCYLGSKNKKGIVAAFYYLSYTISNRFFQLAKCRFGLNIAIGGTGFAVRTAYIAQRGGWKAMSLTEDFEFQIETTIEGKKILWNNNAKVLDEKPTNYAVCFRQQKRWAQGHWYVALKNTKPLFQSLIQHKISFFEFVSTLFYMYSLVPYCLIVLQIPLVILSAVLKYTNAYAHTMYNINTFFSFNVISVLVFFYLFVLIFYIADKMDNNENIDITYIPTLLVSIVVSSLVIAFAKVVGLFCYKNQHTWVKTEHKITSAS